MEEDVYTPVPVYTPLIPIYITMSTAPIDMSNPETAVGSVDLGIADELTSLLATLSVSEPEKVVRRFPPKGTYLAKKLATAVVEENKSESESAIPVTKVIEESKSKPETAVSATATTADPSPYDETITEILRIAKAIVIKKSESGSGSDGRIDSAMKEGPFLEELKKQLLAGHPTWDVVISPPRASCDILVNSVRINLKLTDCKSSDNSVNKPSIFYSLTGQTTYPYSSNWNEFYERLANAKKEGQIKKVRDKVTEYHYLVKNKLTGDVLFKPIFDIHTYVSNPSNDLQINWKNEFTHVDVLTTDADYMKKVESLLVTIQTSVKEMIARTRLFAEADLTALLT
jgi:hypothetical protein